MDRTHFSTRCGVFVMAGKPNAGKSTLLNSLVGEKLAIVSPRPQSTRQPVIGVRTDGNIQLVFVDPPGLLEPRYLLQEAMVADLHKHLARADGVLYLQPADRGEPTPLESLLPAEAHPRVPVLTVRTKTDRQPPAGTPAGDRRDGDHTSQLSGSRSLAVSAVRGQGIETVLVWCRAHAPCAPFRFPPDDVSSQPLRFFAAEFVREAAFEILGEELPYSVAVEIEEFRETRDPVYIRVSLYVERESQKGMVIGSGGRTIKTLGELARSRIEGLVGSQVYLDLWVKVLPKWRTSSQALRHFGFATPVGRNP